MINADMLLTGLLLRLVEQIPDYPRRVLFRGVSHLFGAFVEKAAAEQPDWDVRITRPDTDVVGARNDPNIPVLVVFYQAEVRERESLNAFRLFNDDEIAKELVARLGSADLPGLTELYSVEEKARLNTLLSLVYPSVERLAEFLLQGKAQIGGSLPLLGLFADPELNFELPARQWQARLLENQEAAVLRWRDFLNKGTSTKAGRDLLGASRLPAVRAAETDPAAKEQVLKAVTLTDALSVLNPPSRLVMQILSAGFTRKQAEELVSAVKAGQAGTGGALDLAPLLADLPALPAWLVPELKKLAPAGVDDGSEPEPEICRVNFALEGLLRLAAQRIVDLPAQLDLRRADVPAARVTVTIDPMGHLSVSMSPESCRLLSSADAARTGELQYEVLKPGAQQALYRFTLSVMPEWLDDFSEDWLEEPGFWDRAAGLNAQNAPVWRSLQARLAALREVVDPDWRRENADADATGDSTREPNNAIYGIFDLLYLANRELFDAFLDEWLAAATLPWRDSTMALKPGEWYNAINSLLRVGTSRQVDGKRVVFPFYPLRLAWYREVFRQVEAWIAAAMRTGQSLVFEPAILADQFRPVDRPRVLFNAQQRFVETSAANFFIAQFVAQDQHRRTHPPLYRARHKLDQFGRMWPFSLDRLHLAFQPGDAGEDVYRLLIQESEDKPDAAYRVEALVESTASQTIFDRQLLGQGEDVVDLLTEEHHESILPRVDYAKALAGGADDGSDDAEPKVGAHVALLVDAFSEEGFDFHLGAGKLNPYPEWQRLTELAQAGTAEARVALAAVDICAPPYHTGPVYQNSRDLVYVPLSGDRPEYLRMLYDSLMGWQCRHAFAPGAYVERVQWDVERLQRLHDDADWVILFDRTLDKAMFASLTDSGVRLIDYYANLPGGYQMSVSSGRTDAVKWQLGQVLQQFFPGSELKVRAVAERMLECLSSFASGLLLKTLGGGSLAQELLGLYATYLWLIAEGEFVRGQDQLIPLDDYQSWFGRRTQRGRRADLLVLKNPAPDTVHLLAVESKWYKSDIGKGFVQDEFGPEGQMRTTVTSLRSLFDPRQERLDKDYWRKMLASLLDSAPPSWDPFRQAFGKQAWRLEVDGIVYVHQYQNRDAAGLLAYNDTLNDQVAQCIAFPADNPYFALGSDARRLRLKSRDEIVSLFSA